MNLQFTFDASDAVRKLTKLRGALVDFRKPFKDIKSVQLREVQRVFDTEGAATGKKWQSLKQKTIAQRIASGYGAGPILNRSGTLKKSFKQKSVSRNKLEIGSDVKYFQFHQTGTKKTPQRQVLAHTDEMRSRVLKIFTDYIGNIISNG